MEDFGLEWACRMDFYGCKAVNKLMLMLSSFSAVYTVHFPYILCVCMYVQEFSVYHHNPPFLLSSGNQALEACTPSTVPSPKKYFSIRGLLSLLGGWDCHLSRHQPEYPPVGQVLSGLFSLGLSVIWVSSHHLSALSWHWRIGDSIDFH